MNNLLSALQREKRTMEDKVHNIRLYLKRQSTGTAGLDVISKTPYTEQDLADAESRLEEVTVAVAAIIRHRKEKQGDQPFKIGKLNKKSK